MTTLHLGVMDVPYGNAPSPTSPSKPGRGRRKRNSRAKGSPISITTGQVAEILEAEYRVMEVFYASHEDEIARLLEHSIGGALQSLMMGAPAQATDIFASAASRIEDQFKQFLSTKEIEQLGIPGVPTAAALHGVSHRFANPGKRRAPRPSFIDTGLYQASFKAWVD